MAQARSDSKPIYGDYDLYTTTLVHTESRQQEKYVKNWLKKVCYIILEKMSEQTIIPRLLTVREVVILLRLHRPTVYELIKFGDLEEFKLAADWRVQTSSVDKYVGQISADMLGFKPSDAIKS